MKKKRSRQRIEGGASCPKCRIGMQRFKHPDNWQPPQHRKVFFRYWDQCPRCKHLQHYEEAKVFTSPRARAINEWFMQKRETEKQRAMFPIDNPEKAQ